MTDDPKPQWGRFNPRVGAVLDVIEPPLRLVDDGLIGMYLHANEAQEALDLLVAVLRIEGRVVSEPLQSEIQDLCAALGVAPQMASNTEDHQDESAESRTL